MIIYKKFIFIISIFASYKTEIICEKKKYMTYILLYITQKFGPFLTRISAKSVFFSLSLLPSFSPYLSPPSLSHFLSLSKTNWISNITKTIFTATKRM